MIYTYLDKKFCQLIFAELYSIATYRIDIILYGGFQQ